MQRILLGLDPKQREELEAVLMRTVERLQASIHRSFVEMLTQDLNLVRPRRQWSGPGPSTEWRIKWHTIGPKREWGNWPVKPMGGLHTDKYRSARTQSFPWPFTHDGDWNIEYEMTVDVSMEILGRNIHLPI